jgi:hypothetical protein
MKSTRNLGFDKMEDVKGVQIHDEIFLDKRNLNLFDQVYILLRKKLRPQLRTLLSSLYFSFFSSTSLVRLCPYNSTKTLARMLLTCHLPNPVVYSAE